jgi:hypothetical protein
VVLWKFRSASRSHPARCSVDSTNRHIMSRFRMSGGTEGRRHEYCHPFALLWQSLALHMASYCSVCWRCSACGVTSVTSVRCVCRYSISVVFRRTAGKFQTSEFNTRAFLNGLSIYGPPSDAYRLSIYGPPSDACSRMSLQTSLHLLCAKSLVLPSAFVYHVKTE